MNKVTLKVSYLFRESEDILVLSQNDDVEKAIKESLNYAAQVLRDLVSVEFVSIESEMRK